MSKFMKLFKFSNVIKSFNRNYAIPRNFREPCKKYPGGIVYYPRDMNEKEPKIEPSKLFLVKRIKPVKGNPYWEKRILKVLKLDEKEIAIVKNQPSLNAMLWRVKHLVKILPINFPNGEPTEEDIGSTYLRDNGDLLIAKSLKVSEELLEISEKCRKDPKLLNGDDLRRDSRQKWLTAW